MISASSFLSGGNRTSARSLCRILQYCSFKLKKMYIMTGWQKSRAGCLWSDLEGVGVCDGLGVDGFAMEFAIRVALRLTDRMKARSLGQRTHGELGEGVSQSGEF